MKLLKETSRKVIVIPNYIGVCHSCESPIEYPNKLVLVEISVEGDKHVAVPIDILACPHCLQNITGIALYFNMDITKELAKCVE